MPRSVLIAPEALAPEALEQLFEELERRISSATSATGSVAPISSCSAMRMRLRRPDARDRVPLPDARCDERVIAEMIAAFHTEHLRRFQHADLADPG